MYELFAPVMFFVGLALLVSSIFIGCEESFVDLFNSRIYQIIVVVWLFFLYSVLEFEVYGVREAKQEEYMEIMEVNRGGQIYQFYVERDIGDEFDQYDMNIIEGHYDTEEYHVRATLSIWRAVNWIGDYENWGYEVVKR